MQERKSSSFPSCQETWQVRLFIQDRVINMQGTSIISTKGRLIYHLGEGGGRGYKLGVGWGRGTSKS